MVRKLEHRNTKLEDTSEIKAKDTIAGTDLEPNIQFSDEQCESMFVLVGSLHAPWWRKP